MMLRASRSPNAFRAARCCLGSVSGSANAFRAARRCLGIVPGSANAFRASLAARPVSLQFALIPSAVVTQVMAAAGADAICIDLEHGPIDYKDVQAMVGSMRGSGAAPVVRVPSIEPLSVKRALDLGAEGIVFPLAADAADVERAVRTLHYPPRGDRGFGPFVASAAKGFEFTEATAHYGANPPLCVVLIETAEAVENIDEILDVDGVDCFQLAQFDLSTALGVSGQFDHPTFLAAEKRVEEAAFSRGVALGAVALTEDRAEVLKARGYRLTVGFDVHWLKSSVAAAQAWVAP